MHVTHAERTALISRHLGVSKPFSPLANQINDDIQEALAEVEDLDPVEQARFLSALMLQVSGRLAALHGNR